jgi:hypothetical protein
MFADLFQLLDDKRIKSFLGLNKWGGHKLRKLISAVN